MEHRSIHRHVLEVMPTAPPLPAPDSDPSSTPEPPDPPGIGPALLADLEDVECRAFVDIVESAPEQLRRRLGLQVERRGGMTAIRSSAVDSLLLNRLFVSPAGPVLREDLDALVQGFATSGIDRYLVHVPPPAHSEDIVRWLSACGLSAFRRHWVKFLRGIEPPARAFTDLDIRRAEARDSEAYAGILTHAFQISEAAIPLFAGVIGRKGWHVFVACDGDLPVASAALFVHGRVANLAGAATLPSHRRRGAQGALLAARLEAARAAGCDHVCAETGVRVEGEPNGSYRNMVRVGLRPVYLRRNYARQGLTWAP